MYTFFFLRPLWNNWWNNCAAILYVVYIRTQMKDFFDISVIVFAIALNIIIIHNPWYKKACHSFAVKHLLLNIYSLNLCNDKYRFLYVSVLVEYLSTPYRKFVECSFAVCYLLTQVLSTSYPCQALSFLASFNMKQKRNCDLMRSTRLLRHIDTHNLSLHSSYLKDHNLSLICYVSFLFHYVLSLF